MNASEALLRVHQLIPPQDRPEFTQGREGFFYLERIEGNCEDARADYIIRDHDRIRFEARKDLLRSSVVQVDEEYALRPSVEGGQPVLTIDIRDQYRNMAEVITRPENAHLIESAQRAYAACGVTMRAVPMRGGTDGAQLSFRGLPCANLSACCHNAHSVTELFRSASWRPWSTYYGRSWASTRRAKPVREGFGYLSSIRRGMSLGP